MFRKKRDRRTATYTTSDWDGNRDGAPTNPVVALQELPDGDVHVLADIQDRYGRKRWISVGSSSDSDIRLIEKLANDEEPSVSRDHCEVCRTPRGRVLVRRAAGAYNRTKVNRVRVRKGQVEMAPGDKLILGRVELLALGADGVPRLRITADDPADHVERVVKSTGNTRNAGSFFGVHFSTISRRLKNWSRGKR